MASRAASNAPNLAYLISQVVSTGLKLDAAETALRREQAKAANGGVAPAKTPSHPGRQSAALNQATKALGPNANEPQRLRTALMEAAAERLATDPAFAARVRERYAVGGQATAAKATGQIVPIRPPTLDQYTPYGRFDPHQVMHEYGHAQFRAVLERSTMRDLKEATDFTQQRHPGTRPTSRASKAAMIDYIVANTPPE
jgi:hypothetical protein